jgi:hypothetical protein
MRESKVPAVSSSSASETLPSIWKDEIAFARVYERRTGAKGRYPYIYVRTASGRTVRQPGAPRGGTVLPGPTSLTLNNGRVAFVWNNAEDRRHRRGISTLRLDLPSGRSRLIARTQFRTDLDHYASYLSPTIAGDTLTFGLQKISGLTGGARPPKSTDASVTRYRISARTAATRPVAPFLVSVAPAAGAVIYGESSDGDAWLTPLGTVIHIP